MFTATKPTGSGGDNLRGIASSSAGWQAEETLGIQVQGDNLGDNRSREGLGPGRQNERAVRNEPRRQNERAVRSEPRRRVERYPEKRDIQRREISREKRYSGRYPGRGQNNMNKSTALPGFPAAAPCGKLDSLRRNNSIVRRCCRCQPCC